MFKKLLKLLLFIFIIVMVFFPTFAPAISAWLTSAGLPTLSSFVTSLAQAPWWVTGAIGLGLSYMIAPDTTAEMISDVGNGISQLIDVAGDVAGDALGAASDALFSGVGPLLIGAGLLWFFFVREKQERPSGLIERSVPNAENASS